MPADLLKEKREILFREIANIMETWPEQQRQVFSLVHYNGKSPAATSSILAVGAEEVRSILDKCEQQLHRSLRSLHKARLDDTLPASKDPVACTRPQAPLSLGAQTACR